MHEMIYNDNDYICGTSLPWKELLKATILVTGANGLIGSALCRALYFLNARYALQMQIIAHTRESGGDIVTALRVSEPVDYIFHCAAMTASKDMIEKPLEVIRTSVDGTKNILDFAYKIGCKSVVYLSSMEVYGQIDGEITEERLGYLDLQSPRTSYPESKRMCEVLCTAYNKQFSVPVKIARLAQTFGAGTPKSDSRVFAQFARAVVNGSNIILHTDGTTLGNYCYIADTVTALFTLLLKGENGQVYNVSNPDTCMTIREMAELVAIEYGVNVIVDKPINPGQFGYAAPSRFKLDIGKIRVLGWEPNYSLLDCYHRMIEAWDE